MRVFENVVKNVSIPLIALPTSDVWEAGSISIKAICTALSVLTNTRPIILNSNIRDNVYKLWHSNCA